MEILSSKTPLEVLPIFLPRPGLERSVWVCSVLGHAFSAFTGTTPVTDQGERSSIAFCLGDARQRRIGAGEPSGAGQGGAGCCHTRGVRRSGYAAVTVDDAARAAGISWATFFRYFGSKEDVVVASVESTKIDYLAGIEAMPAGQHTSGWGLLRAAIELVVQAATQEPEGLRARLRLISSEPALKARLRERRAANTEALSAALSKHMTMSCRPLSLLPPASPWLISTGRNGRRGKALTSARSSITMSPAGTPSGGDWTAPFVNVMYDFVQLDWPAQN